MIRLNIAVWSDVGRKRELNEDRVFYQLLEIADIEPVAMCIVADGMGGHLAGEVASHWVVETLKRELAELFIPPDPRQTVQLSGQELKELAQAANNGLRPSDVPITKRLRKAVQRANTAVYEYAIHRPAEAMGTGSTLTMAFVRGKRAYVVNVGDSRTYLLRQGNLIQLTRDHSHVAELIAAGQISIEESWDHPQAGLITRCLGYLEEVQPDVTVHDLKPGDCLLLCSDGLWEMLRNPALMARIIVSAPDPYQAVQRLVEAANHAGGKDNISVALLYVVEQPDMVF
ncbi:MAG: serine/threonine-protein phosphatase [Anaerolineae bacterium]|nr:serine/threonine-protein phosphatase [Anaerolineae bacterium]